MNKELWSKIGDGGTAEIYLDESGRVVKWFREGFSEAAAASEYRKSEWAYAAGLPTAKPLGLTNLEGRQVLLLERLEGESLLQRLQREPETAEEAARKFAAYHVQLNKREAAALEDDQRSRLVQRIGWADRLSESERRQVLEALELLPDGQQFCHGDFHPGNIMENGEDWQVIDWIDANCGHPLYDAARTLLLLGFGTDEGGARGRMEEAAAVFRSAYLQTYSEQSGFGRDEIERWMLPAAAVRLVEPIPESEKDKLAQYVRSRLL